MEGGGLVAKDKENITNVVVEETKFGGKRKSRKRNRHKRRFPKVLVSQGGKLNKC